MGKIDDAIAALQKQKLEQEKLIEDATKGTVLKTSRNIPWMNIFMFGTILVMGYFLWQNKNISPNPGPDPVPVINVTDEVTKYENLYSTYKSQSYNKIAELVENKTINNRNQLMSNTQAILEKAREASLGKLDELDNKYLPEESFEEKRSEVVSYLKQKASGFEKAGK